MAEREDPSSTTPKYPKGRISDMVPFSDVAKTLERVITCESTEGKKKLKYLQKLVDSYRKAYKNTFGSLDSNAGGGDSVYPIIRILLPRADRGRRAYGFQAHALGRMFVHILGLDKNSKDGKSLLHYKDPKSAGSCVGDVAELIYKIMESRFSSNEGKLTAEKILYLSDIHDILDTIARDSESSEVNQEYQKKVLHSVIRRLTSLEVKWLIRILLKDLRLGLNSTAVYGLLHKQARVLSERMGNLELLCQKLNDPEVEVSDMDISLFNHFCPMLATRMDIIDSAFENDPSSLESTSKPKKNMVTLPSPPFYVETKWDGERFQIHFDGTEFKYFSRRAHDYSQKFNETLTPRLRLQISSSVQSFIVDGEMMAYHKRHKMFTQKGYDIDVKTMKKDNPNHCPVFVAFDLVYLNGIVLTKMPLKDRRDKLISAFQPKEDVIRVGEIKTMNTKKEVVDCLNAAIDDGEEGLIVKDVNSPYIPGKRDLSWLKIKPEYLEDNSVDDLDLVILGAYYTDSNRRGGEINHFLIGLVEKVPGKKAQYYPIAKVGTGRLRSHDMKELVQKLMPKFVKSSSSTANSAWNNVHLRQRKKPDFLICPQDSVVVQVKASEIVPSDVYSSLGYTLRFPRVVRTREDKSPHEIMSVEEFNRLREACGGKLAKRSDVKKGKYSNAFAKRRHAGRDDNDSDKDTDDEGPSARKRFLKENSPNLFDEEDLDDSNVEPGCSSTSQNIKSKGSLFPQSSFKFGAKKSPSKSGPASTSATSTLSPKKSTRVVLKDIFNSKVFCVYGTSIWKSEIEAKIQQYGGSISQTPMVPDLFCVVGQRKTRIPIERAIRSGKYDVMSSAWIERCIKEGEALPLGFADYWATTNATKERLINEGESYSESYSEETIIDEKVEDNAALDDPTGEDPSRSQSPKSVACIKSTTASQSSVPASSPTKRKLAPMAFDDDDNSSSDTDFDPNEEKTSVPPGSTSKNDNETAEGKNSDSDSTDFSDSEMNEVIRSKRKSASLKDNGPSGKIKSNEDDQDAQGKEDNNKSDEEVLSADLKFMSDIEAVFRGVINPSIVSKFKRFGGVVLMDEGDKNLTHIIVCNEGNPSKKAHSRALVVKQKWLEDCLEKLEVLDEWCYCVR